MERRVSGRLGRGFRLDDAIRAHRALPDNAIVFAVGAGEGLVVPLGLWLWLQA